MTNTFNETTSLAPIDSLINTFNKTTPRVSELNTLIRKWANETNSIIDEKVFKKFLFYLFDCTFVLSDSDIQLQYPKNKVIPEYDEKIYEQLVTQDKIILPGDTNTTNTILLSLNLIDIHDKSNEFYIPKPTTNGLMVNDIKDKLFSRPFDEDGHRDRNLPKKADGGKRSRRRKTKRRNRKRSKKGKSKRRSSRR